MEINETLTIDGIDPSVFALLFNPEQPERRYRVEWRVERPSALRHPLSWFHWGRAHGFRTRAFKTVLYSCAVEQDQFGVLQMHPLSDPADLRTFREPER